MAFFLPSSFQKRLLRYALSRLELVDTDELELDNLDIAWGARSSVELKDVGLRTDKITSLLQLPPQLRLQSAKILLLRLTIPADIYSSSIVVEIEGVHVQVEASLEPHDDESPEALPTTDDLAKSFLQTEPVAQEELQAIEDSQLQYSISGSGDLGTGTALALPVFLSDFLAGIVDRLTVTVKNVEIKVDIEQPELGPLGLVFQVDEVEVPGLNNPTKRHVNLRNIKGSLVCEPGLFESLQTQDTQSMISDSTAKAQLSEGSSVGTDSRLLRSEIDSRLLDSPLQSELLDSVVESQLLRSEVSGTTTSSASERRERSVSDASESTISGPQSSSDASSRMAHSVITTDNDRFADYDGHSDIMTRSNAPTASDDGRFDDPDEEVDMSMAQSIFGRFEDYEPSERPPPDEDLHSGLAASSGTLPFGENWLGQDLYASTSAASETSIGVPHSVSASSIGFGPSLSVASSSVAQSASAASLAPNLYPLPPSEDASGATTPVPHESGTSTPVARSDSDRSSGSNEDLLESKLFSHEEAESMYMSAMSHYSDARTEQARSQTSDEQTVPGGWGEKSVATEPKSSTTDEKSVTTVARNSRVLQPGSLITKPLLRLDSLSLLIPNSSTELDPQAIELHLGKVVIAADITVCRIAVALAKAVPTSEGSSGSSGPPLKARIDALRINFVDSMNGEDTEILLSARLDGIFFEKASYTDLKISKFRFGYSDDTIVFFEEADMQASMQASVLSQRTLMQASMRPSTEMSPDIHVTIKSSIEVTTRPVHVKVDLPRLDETFSWLGGFSSMISSTSTAQSVQIPTLNVKAHIGGVLIDLISNYTIQLRSASADIAIRGGASTARISVISISGPVRRSEDPPMLINLCDLVLHYRLYPEKADLEKLETLTMSDDILLDTLLRQRRQGARMKLQLSEISCEISDPSKLQVLPRMLEDIAKLGTVAKYLPDDERPGILTLCEVERVRAYIDVDGLGEVSIDISNVDVAHVGVPLLIAVSISAVEVYHGKQNLMGEVLSSNGAMIRFRMIGDEPEPTLKIKLFNFRIEYYVSIIMALLNLKEATTEDMINSVPALKVKSTRTWHLDIGLRDCMLGLNPQGQPSKALLLLSKVGVMVAFSDAIEGELKISKTYLLVIDDMENVNEPPGPEYPFSRRLTEMGFVTVTTISSARAKLRFSGPADDRQVDLQLSDDLLVVESCADSTRTLIDLASGLTPPLPKSTALQYRTEVVPVQDMLASLSGDAFSEEEWELDPFEEQDEEPTDLVIEEGHFARSGETANKWNSVQNAYVRAEHSNLKHSPLRVRIKDVHIIWNLFDGYDWAGTRNTISKAVKDVEEKAIKKQRDKKVQFDVEDDESEIGDFLFNSIYIGIPSNRDPHELTEHIEQELEGPQLKRSRHHKMTFELKGVSLDFVVYPPGDETQSMLDLRVRDLDVFDHVPTSTWRKFATYMRDAGERETGSSMIRLEILNVKPIADLAASEMVLKVSVLPIRLHVDQDALDFVTRFFEFKSGPAGPPPDEPFLQRVEVNSVRVKLDYKPKKVDYAGLRSGHTTEFMNFVILDAAEFELRHIIIYGVRGFDRLSKTLNDIWMPDVRTNQLKGVLAGLAPVRSIVNVGSGVRDLVVIPIKEYQKDGRIVRSIQKGALAFAKTTTSELTKLGAKVAIGTQTVLQSAEDYLVPKPEQEKAISHYADQPVGVAQGLQGAYRSLERDLIVARDAIIAVPGEVMLSNNAQDAAKVMLKRAPTVILRPAIGASKAISQTLLGATNSLDRQNLQRVQDKYKRH